MVDAIEVSNIYKCLLIQHVFQNEGCRISGDLPVAIHVVLEFSAVFVVVAVAAAVVAHVQPVAAIAVVDCSA